MDDLFADLLTIAPCCMEGDLGEKEYCVCGDTERVLRSYLGGGQRPMTAEEREWCLEESDRAGEGAYPREEAEGYTDSELAQRVLWAWSDYVNSNCS